MSEAARGIRRIRRAQLLGLLALCLGFGCAGERRSLDPRPNVALIMIDTLRADRLSSYGYPAQTSPELDRLAAQGLRFANVIAASSWTRPSMGAMLTSRYPRSLGIYKEVGHLLADEFWTLAEALRRAGYWTVGATANPQLNRSFNFAQGFEEYLDSTVLFPWMQDGVEPGEFQSAEQIFGALLERIESSGRSTRQPIYLQAAIMEVHESLEDTRRPARFRGGFAGLPDPTYLESVRHVSFLVDRFIAQLSALEGWENTLFVITSDHGHGLSDHPSIESHSAETRPIARQHGWLLYESTQRVPLILYATSEALLPRGRVLEQQVGLLDVMPTLLDLLGVPAGEAEGRSLRPLWEANAVEAAAAWPRFQVAESQFRGTDLLAIYSQDWSYHAFKRPIPRVEPLELQRNGTPQDGAATNRLREEPAAAVALAEYLRAWEQEHPRRDPTWLLEPLPRDEAEQLKAIGYR